MSRKSRKKAARTRLVRRALDRELKRTIKRALARKKEERP